MSYFYGKGEDEVVSNLSKEHRAVADVLHSLVYTDICWDVVKRIRLEREIIIDRDFSRRAEKISEAANRMKRVFGSKNTSIDAFKVHVIQSDSVNVHPHISDFFNGQILVHSDSRTFSVNKILYPEYLQKRLEFFDNNMPKSIDSSNSAFANVIIRAKDDEIERNFASVMHQLPGEIYNYQLRNDDNTVEEFLISLTKVNIGGKK